LEADPTGAGFGEAELDLEGIRFAESALAESAAAALSFFDGVKEEGIAAESASPGAESDWTGAAGRETVSTDAAPAPIPVSGDTRFSLHPASETTTAMTARDDTPLMISSRVGRPGNYPVRGCTLSAAPAA
jgi:hypothetical protein